MKLKTLKEVLASKEAMDRFDSYCRQDVGLTRTLLVYLVGIASARKLTDYNQAGAVVGLAGSSSILWEMLGDISRFTYDSCDVFLSAVVQKAKKNNTAGRGLYDVMRECGVPVVNEFVTLINSVAACYVAGF